MECPCSQLGSDVLAVSSPSFSPTLSPLTGGVAGEAKALNLYQHCSAITKTLRVTNTLFLTNPKHGSIPATVKKINSTSDKASTQSSQLFSLIPAVHPGETIAWNLCLGFELFYKDTAPSNMLPPYLNDWHLHFGLEICDWVHETRRKGRTGQTGVNPGLSF